MVTKEDLTKELDAVRNVPKEVLGTDAHGGGKPRLYPEHADLCDVLLDLSHAAREEWVRMFCDAASQEFAAKEVAPIGPADSTMIAALRGEVTGLRATRRRLVFGWLQQFQESNAKIVALTRERDHWLQAVVARSAELDNQRKRLERVADRLRGENGRLRGENSKLQNTNAALEREIARLALPPPPPLPPSRVTSSPSPPPPPPPPPPPLPSPVATYAPPLPFRT